MVPSKTFALTHDLRCHKLKSNSKVRNFYNIPLNKLAIQCLIYFKNTTTKMCHNNSPIRSI